MKSIDSGKPIFAFVRKDFPEVILHACWAVKYQGKALASEYSDMYFVTRSLLKPWQLLAISKIGEEDYWTLGFSSHSGQVQHMEQLQKLMEAVGASEGDLVCPRSFPLDTTVATRMRDQQQPANRILHPCAGKHLAMIAACKELGVKTDHYWDPDHPIQEKIFSFVAKEANEKLFWLTDSCGVPNAAMTVRAHLNMWEKLALATDERSQRLKHAWLKNYRLVGGKNRLDSDLVEIGKGRLLVKEGADGLLVVQSLSENGEPVASIFVKLLSGYSSAFLALSLHCLIQRTPDLPAVFKDVQQYLDSRLDEWIPRDQNLKVLL